MTVDPRDGAGRPDGPRMDLVPPRDLPTAAGLALGAAADLLLADPRRWHPVAGFGRAAAALERPLWRDSRAAGAAYAGLLTGAATGLGVLLDRATRGRPAVRTLVTAATTWAVLGGTSLGRAGTAMARTLDAGDLPAARALLPTLAGRDPSALDVPELARATVESVAENTSDAAVAPLVWGALAGLPGLLGYRAVNTLDAMVGHRSPRYARFGWAAARLDDVANWVPARLTAALTVACAPLVGGSPRAALLVWRGVRAGGRSRRTWPAGRWSPVRCGPGRPPWPWRPAGSGPRAGARGDVAS